MRADRTDFFLIATIALMSVAWTDANAQKGFSRGSAMVARPNNPTPMRAIAAPGADILVVNAEGGYEALSGTSSFGAAEVSGIVALMLQREPTLGADKARDILMATAKDLGPKAAIRCSVPVLPTLTAR